MSPTVSGAVHPPRLNWQTELLGFDGARAEPIPLTRKGGRITSLALADHVGEAPKALALMMGGNHFPSEANREPLVEALAGFAN